MYIKVKKDPIEKIDELNKKGVIKTISLKQGPRYKPKYGPAIDKKKWDKAWERIFGRR